MMALINNWLIVQPRNSPISITERGRATLDAYRAERDAPSRDGK